MRPLGGARRRHGAAGVPSRPGAGRVRRVAVEAPETPRRFARVIAAESPLVRLLHSTFRGCGPALRCPSASGRRKRHIAGPVPYIVCAAQGVALATFFSSLAPSQTNPEGHSPPPAAASHGPAGATQPSFRADSNLVVIPISVTDTVNRFVLGLRKEDFRLFDDGVEQPIAHFSGEDIPLSIGLAFDISGSMDNKLTTSREAAVLLLKS